MGMSQVRDDGALGRDTEAVRLTGTGDHVDVKGSAPLTLSR